MSEERHLERYIGDGAYVYCDDCGNVVIYASNGYIETDRVVIDVDDMPALTRWLTDRLEYVNAIRDEQRAAREAE